MKIAVIGAGIVGLSTALAIQENIPGIEVTVISDQFSPDTTGDAAAGIILANLMRLQGTSPTLIKQILQESFAHFDHILNSQEAMAAGVSRLSGYILYRKNIPERIIYDDIVYCCRPCTKNELKSIPGGFELGLFVTTLQIECRLHLPWLLNRIIKNGGKVEQKKIHNLQELFGQYEVIVNCAALGNVELTGDNIIIPVRGQAVRVSAPGVRHFYIDNDGNVAVIPCRDTVHLGSIFQMNDWDTMVRPDERKTIIKQSKKLVPALEGATFVRDVVGLRPWREPARMEREAIPYGTGTQQVVHNYGHSSTGVALSWGAAKHATNMVKEALKMSPQSAKL